MYGQGNYASQVGQGPYPSRRPFQHPPQGPPPPAFQQGPPAPRLPMYQHGPPIPPLVGQPGHPVYHHVPSGPSQQVPQLPVPSTGISSGQSYLSPHPPPPPPLQVHGGSQMPHFRSSAQQQSQWAQNAHHDPPAVSSLGPGSVMPPSLQGQALYRGQVPQGGVQVPQHALPPPPLPPLSGSFRLPSFGSTAIPMTQHPHMASMVPPRPPLPSSPPRSPPHPPASPPPKTSSPGSKAKAQFSESILRLGPNNDYTDHVMASVADDRVGAQNQSGDSLPALCNPSEHDLVTGSSGQPDNVVDAGRSCSPCDSDMDMEDDITHPDEDEQSRFFNEPTCGSFRTCTEQEKSEQLQASSGAGKHTLAEDTFAEKLSCSVSSGSEDQEQAPKVSRDHDETPGKSSPKLDGSVLNSIGQTELPFSSIACGSSSPHTDLIKPSASANVAGNDSEKLSKANSQGTSPFRLLQDYASDDSSENGQDKDVTRVAVSPSAKAGIVSFGTDINHSFGDGLRSESLLVCEKGVDLVPESSAVCSRSIPPQSIESSLLERIVSQADATSIATGEVEKLVDNKHGNQEFSKVHSSPKVLQNTNALRDDIVDGHARSGNLQKEDPKSISGGLKVDEFGRLIRENPSDCDSGDSPRYTRRHGRRGGSRSPKRGRSRSRSQSPIRGRSRSRGRSPVRGRSRSRSQSPLRGRSHSRSRSPHGRRRRSSPWRRRERRGWSRSLSPKRHRSRSKSPSYRRGGELGDKVRRDKALPECFDFIRGKCYRGASCRYVHHESDKAERSRSYRSKLQKDVQTSSKSTDLYRKNETTSKRTVDEHNGSKQDLLVIEKREDVKEELGNSTSQLRDKESCVDSPVRQVGSAENENFAGGFADPAPASKDSETQQIQVHCSDQVIQNTDGQHQQMNDSLGPQISPVQTSGTVERVPPVNRPYLNQGSANQSYAGMSSMDGHFSSRDICSQTLPELSPSGSHSSHLLPSFPSLSQDTGANFSQQMARDYNLISPATKFPHQHSQFPVPSTTSWNSLPLPPPPLPFGKHSNVTPGEYGLPSVQFQQNMSPPRSDFPYGASVRPYGAEFLSVSQGGQQETYSTVQESYRSSYHRDDFGPGTLPVMSKPMGQPHVGPGPGGEDCTTGRPPQDVYTRSSFSQDNLHAEHPPFPSSSPSQRMHTFPSDKMSPGGFSGPSSQSYPYLHQPFYGLPPASEGASAHLCEPRNIMPTMSRYASDNFEKDRPSHLPAFTGSRFSSHFNPYASTFDQPLSSKFSSNILTLEKDMSYSHKYGTPCNLSRVPADGLAVAAKGSSLTPVCDQYDPLCDSIEPTSTSVKKPDFGQQHEQADGSDIMLRMSVSNKSLDAEEQNRQKGSGAVARTISLENDEYGETADAEVGAVENGSASNPHDTTDMAAGDVEIDQVKPPGKIKSSKDSKSMKLFKIAIADFVKEVLKPSWRQGNMSKEAFKTIVKKTVDKVSGALKSHQVPKSRAKIDHYIDSSRRKLTKLVMGYVDKYVKV